MGRKLKKLDRVRLRILPPEDRKRLERIAESRGIKIQLALRVLRRRFNYDLDAYEKAWPNAATRLRRKARKKVVDFNGMTVGSALAALVDVYGEEEP